MGSTRKHLVLGMWEDPEVCFRYVDLEAATEKFKRT